MKLVVFGLTLSSSWGNGHATVWRSLAKGWIARGHDFVFFERDVPYYAAHRDLSAILGGAIYFYSEFEEVRADAEQELAAAEVAMVTSYCPDALEATEVVLNSRAELKVFYDLDAPVTLSRLARAEAVSYIGPRGFSDFDLVLSFTGGVALERLKNDLGARQVAPLYGSIDPQIYAPVPPEDKYCCDLSYLGTYADDRQATLRTLFVEPARRLPEKRFVLGGAQYPQFFPWTENIFFVRHVAPFEHPVFYSSSKLTLNVTRQAMRDMGYCPSGRLFEASACAAPILSDAWLGIEEFFTPGEEILIAHSTEDAIEAIESESERLKRIGQAARRRTLAEHTGSQRAMQLEAIIESCLREIPPAAGASLH